MKITHSTKVKASEDLVVDHNSDYITDSYGRKVFAPKPVGGDGKNYISYYTGHGYAGPKEILEDAKKRGFSKIFWGSDESYGMHGMYNGDMYIAYNDANLLPKGYKEDALDAEAHNNVTSSTEIEGSKREEPDLKCRKVAENDNTIEYVVSSEDISKPRWMGKYLTNSGKIKHVYFDCNCSEWNDASDRFESIIPEPYQSCKLLGKAPDNIECSEDFTYIEGSMDNSIINQTTMDELKAKLGSATHRFMVDKMGFDEEDDPNDRYSMGADHFWRIDVKEITNELDGTPGIYIELGAELGYESTDKLLDRLNPIVRQYDDDAYFEPYDPGINVCYLWGENTNASSKIEGASPVTDTRDNWLEPKEGDVEAVDGEQEIDVMIDADIDIADDGSYDYDSLDFAKSNERDGNYYVEMDDLVDTVQLRDYTSVVEDIDELLMYKIPDAKGKHHISGQAHLVYDISGLTRYPDGIYEEDFHAKFNRNKSHIDRFKFD